MISYFENSKFTEFFLLSLIYIRKNVRNAKENLCVEQNTLQIILTK